MLLSSVLHWDGNLIEDFADEGVGVAPAEPGLGGKHDAVAEDGRREVLNVVGQDKAATAHGSQRA